MTDTHLDELEASGMVRLAAIDPELEYLFRHVLVQEAAYSSLLKQERRQLHLEAGDILERLYPDRLGELAPELAQHFEEGGDDARALEYLVKAGEHAMERTAYPEARAFLDRAAERLAAEPDTDATRRLRVKVALGQVQSGWAFGAAAENIAVLDRALVEAKALGDARLEAELYVWIVVLRQFEGELPATSPALAEAVERSVELAERLGDESIQAIPLAMSGMALAYSGEVKRGAELLERAVPLLAQRHMSIAASFVAGSLGSVYAMMGDFDKARELIQTSLDVAADGDPIAYLDARLAQGFVEVWSGNMEAAGAIGAECDARAEELGAFSCSVAGKYLRGVSSMDGGDLDEARRHLEASDEIAQTSMQGMRPTVLAALGTAHARIGDRDKARQTWEEALGMARAMGVRPDEATILLSRGRAFSSESAPDEDLEPALADLETSAGMFEDMGMIPDLVRALKALGAGLKRAGREEEGARQLARAAELKGSVPAAQ